MPTHTHTCVAEPPFKRSAFDAKLLPVIGSVRAEQPLSRSSLLVLYYQTSSVQLRVPTSVCTSRAEFRALELLFRLETRVLSFELFEPFDPATFITFLVIL